MAYCADHPVHDAATKVAATNIAARKSPKTAGLTAAAKAIAASSVIRLQRYLKVRHEQRTKRAAFQNLLTLDDATLKDIGVNRGDVTWANSLPLSVNAAEELRLLTLQNRSSNRK